ncbi:MAG: diacylglyceryl transferase [Flavobacteriales bacterium]|nr:diacylglyceryl transferase [Flavobacteriales bacterium]
MTYPTISHFIEKATGIFIPLPIQTFGFFIVTAFIIAHFFIKKEFIRLEKNNKINTVSFTKNKNNYNILYDYIFNGLLSFLFGFKIIYIIKNYELFSQYPQQVLLSKDGNILLGFIFFTISNILIYYSDKQNEKTKKTKDILPSSLSWNFIFIAGLSGIIGAKLFAVLEDFNYLITNPIDAIFSFSGLTFYGGLIFGTISVILYAKKYKIKITYLADIFAPSLILAYGVGRLGCHFSGDGDWGIIANMDKKPIFLPDWFWGYDFPHNVIEAGQKIDGCIGMYCNKLPYLVYPTALYEACFGILAFIFLYKIRKFIKIPGMLFCLYLILNGTERFLIEIIRITDKYTVFGMNFTQAQIIGILLIIIGISGSLYLKQKNNELIQE